MDNITSSKEDEVSFGSALNPFDHEIALSLVDRAPEIRRRRLLA
jgi:hypothetical protein